MERARTSPVFRMLLTLVQFRAQGRQQGETSEERTAVVKRCLYSRTLEEGDSVRKIAAVIATSNGTLQWNFDATRQCLYSHVE
jgi:hypothetical protein